MLDIKQIRNNPTEVQERLSTRGDYDLTEILALDQQQRELETKRTELQTRSNEVGKAVGQKIKGGADPKGEAVAALREEGNQIKKQLADLEPQERELKDKIHSLVIGLPNLPDSETPVGKTEDDNVEVRRWGDELIPQRDDILPHYEIGEKLGWLNFERAARIAQSRLVALMDNGAAQERA